MAEKRQADRALGSLYSLFDINLLMKIVFVDWLHQEGRKHLLGAVHLLNDEETVLNRN